VVVDFLFLVHPLAFPSLEKTQCRCRYTRLGELRCASGLPAIVSDPVLQFLQGKCVGE
jgi:hypothetical protein